MPDKLYNAYSLEKNNDEVSGSMTIWQDTPFSPYDVGDTFRPVPDAPLLKVRSVNISDNVIGDFNGKPLRQWQVVIEGSTSSEQSQKSEIKYSFNIDTDGQSGTMEVSNTGASPIVNIKVGDSFTIPKLGSVKCTNIRVSNSFNDKSEQVWTVVYEGTATTSSDESGSTEPVVISGVKYSSNEAADGKSGSMETTNIGDTPAVTHRIGDSFTIPNLGSVTCTNIRVSNSYNDKGAKVWTVVYEGTATTSSSSSGSSIPEDEISVSHELNGVTVRTVAGEFIALRRSPTPITKKSITIYNNSENAIASIGQNYSGGIALSESITKETIKVNGITTGFYYRHNIEVEA